MEERIREEKKQIYFIIRVDEKNREKCCRVSQFTLAKLNESSPWQSCSDRSIWRKRTCTS